MPLYTDVANRLIKLLDQGALKDGDKLPSIRNFSKDLSISINTVKEAYQYLEDKNYIYSKPQSGFYIRNINREFSDTPNNSYINLSPKEVSMCKIYFDKIEDGRGSPGSELSICLLDRDLWPTKKLSYYYQEALKSDIEGFYNYTLPPGNIHLREQIAIQSVRAKMNITPSDIIITSGCTDSISLAIMSLCESGDVIAVQSPSYASILQICKELKVKIIEVPNDIDDNLCINTLNFVLENHNIKAFFCIPNFNNPTGNMMADSMKKELVECMEKYNIPLIEDDIYGDLHYRENRPTTCKSYDKTGNVILCSSFSKVISPGLRLGWIVPGKYYDIIEKKKLLFSHGTNSASQIVVANFLKEGGYERHNRKIRTILKEQCNSIVKCVLNNFPEGTEIKVPTGGLALWVKLPSEVDTYKIFNNIKGKDILFSPGAIYSVTNKFNNHMRFNIGTWNKSIERALITIANEIKKILSGKGDA